MISKIIVGQFNNLIKEIIILVLSTTKQENKIY